MNPTSTLREKMAAARVVLSCKTSHPVVTIAIRDRVEIEMKARRQAEINRLIYEANLSKEEAEAEVSPGGLDGA